MPEQTTTAALPPGPAAVADAGVVTVAPPDVEAPPSTVDVDGLLTQGMVGDGQLRAEPPPPSRRRFWVI